MKMNTKKLSGWKLISFFGIIVVVCLTLFGTLLTLVSYLKFQENAEISKLGLPSPMATPSSKTFPVIIEYPASWVFREVTKGIHGDLEIFGYISYFQPLPVVEMAKKKFEHGNLEDVKEWGFVRDQKMCKSIEAGTYQENIETQLAEGTFEYNCKVHSTTENVLAKCLDYYTIRDSMGYAFTFCGKMDQWEKVEPVFRQMIRSIIFR